MTEFSREFFVDPPLRMSRAERHRIEGIKTVIAGLQDIALREYTLEEVPEIIERHEQLTFWTD